MADRTDVLNSQSTRLAFMKEFDDLTKLPITIFPLKICSEVVPFITSVDVMKNDSHSWRHVCLLFIKMSKGSDSTLANRAQMNSIESSYLAQMPRTFPLQNLSLSRRDVKCFYSNKKRTFRETGKHGKGKEQVSLQALTNEREGTRSNEDKKQILD